MSQVQQNKVGLDIIHQVREAILEGRLRPGNHLPPEKELVANLGVSQDSLRESVRSLEAIGFLPIPEGAGCGAVMLEADMQTMRDSIAYFLHFQNVSVRDLSEVRKMFEPYLTRLPAEGLGA